MYGIEESPWVVDAFYPPLEMVGGMVAIPEGPGRGIAMNEEWLEKAPHRRTELSRR
jgi:L-alanine-DL-glutamate epimerase-like enolase superfamily enzyme